MNCIIIDDDELSRKVIESFVEKTEFLNHVGSFPSAPDAMSVLQGDDPVDLIFLDVEMPEMTGLEFLQTLENSPQVIIISGQQKYALEAFEFNVTDYLLKPINLARYYKSVNKAHKRYLESTNVSGGNDEIFIKKKNSTLVRLKYDDILFVEALENYVIVCTHDQKFTIHFTMKAIANKLPGAKFKRVHRSYIVNINRIEVIEDNAIIISLSTGKKVIPIGKSYKDKLMNDLNLISK